MNSFIQQLISSDDNYIQLLFIEKALDFLSISKLRADGRKLTLAVATVLCVDTNTYKQILAAVVGVRIP